MGITAVTSVVSALIQAHKKAKQEMIDTATAATTSWNESQQSLADYQAKYTELKTSLDSGTLNSSEEYSTRMELLSLQSEIIAQYGEQAEGINLVNGSLETQVSLLSQISEKNAKENLRENYKEYNDAKKEMEKDNRTYELAYSTGNDTIESEIGKLADKYGLHNTPSADGYTSVFTFTGDASQAEEVIDNFMADVQDLQSQYDEGSTGYNLLGGILGTSEKAAEKNNEVLSKYKDNYNSWMEQDLYSKGKGDFVTDYAKAIDNYNEAMATGDQEKIAETRKSYNDLKGSVSNDNTLKDKKQFFDDLDEGIDETAVKYSDFMGAISGKSDKYNQFDKQSKDLKSYADTLKELGLTSADILAMYDDDKISPGEREFANLADMFGTALFDPDQSQAFIDMLSEAGIVAGETADEVNNASESIKSVEDLSSMIDAAKTNLSNVQTAMSNSNSASGMTVEDIQNVTSAYQDLVDKNYLSDDTVLSAIERTSSGLKINRDRLSELNQMEEQYTKNQFVKSLNDQVKALNDYRNANKDIAGTDEYNTAIGEYQSQIEQIRNMKSEYDGLTSAYNKWQMAQSNGEDGDRYTSVSGAKTTEQTAFEKGKTGTEDFKTYVDYLWSGSTASYSAKEISDVYSKINSVTSGWFTQADSEKNIDALDAEKLSIESFADSVQNKLSPALEKYADRSSLSSIDSDTKKATLDVRDFADAWGVSADVVEDMGGLMKDWGWDVTITGISNNTSNLEEMGDAFSTAQQKLQELNVAGADGFNWDTMDVSLLNTQIDGALDLLSQFRNEDGSINVEMEGAQEAITILETLIRKREELENNNNILLDVQTNSTGANAVQSFMDNKNAYDTDYQLKVNAGVDVNLDESESTAQESFEKAKSSIEKAFESEEVSAELKGKFDFENMDMDSLEDTIQNLTPEEQQELALALKVDSSELDEAQAKKDELVGGAENVNITANVNGTEDVTSLENELASLPPDSTATLTMNVQNNDQLTSAVSSLKEIPPDVSANVSINVPEGQAEEVQKVISELNSTRDSDHQITATINTTIGETPETVDANVQFPNASSDLQSAIEGGSYTAEVELKQKDSDGLQQQSTEPEVTVKATEMDTSGLAGDPVKVPVEPDTSNMTTAPVEVEGEMHGVTLATNEELTLPVNGEVNSITGVSDEQVTVPTIAEVQDVVGAEDSTVTVGVIANVEGTTGGEEALDQTAEVTYEKDSSQVDGYEPEDKTPSVNYSLYAPAPPSYENMIRTVTYFVRTIGTAPSGGTRLLAAGTAHAQGTVSSSLASGLAFASGVINKNIPRNVFSDKKYRTTKDQLALTGELGQELIVDPTKNSWRLTPSTGASFENIPANSIVFNHEQTKQLLEQGFTKGRGKAHAGGTALASGTAFASGSSKDDENWVDFIERTLKRLAHALEEFTNKAELYTGYITQNSMLQQGIDQARRNIQEYTNAYRGYMDKANGVGLAQGYKDKIINGTISIENITDETVKKQVQQFQEWYDAAQDVRDEIIDLNKQIREMAVQKFDNITESFSGLVDLTQAIYDNWEAGSKLAELRDGQSNDGYYDIMYSQMINQAAYLRGEAEKERASMDESVANGTITKWSREWVDMQTQLHKTNQAIQEAEQAVYELRQEQRELHWKEFTDGIEKIENFQDAIESLSSMMSDLNAFDENGVINKNGITQIGLLTTSLGSARQQIAEYNTAIEALGKELENGNINQATYNEELQKYSSAQMEAVENAKSYKDAILDLVKDGIDKETDAMQELIDTRRDDLQAQKEAVDYARTIRDKTTEINKVQAQIEALSGDDSASAKAQVRNLKNQLAELQQDLKDAQDDHQYDILMDGYDNAMDAFEKVQDDTKTELETDTDAQNKAIEDMLLKAKDSYETVYGELTKFADEYGFKLSNDVVDPWKNATNAIDEYLSAVNKANGNLNINTDKLTSTTTTVSDATYAESVTGTPDNNVNVAPPQTQAGVIGHAKVVNTSVLNVRTGAGTNNGILSSYPHLNRGNQVDILGQQGNWYHIRIAGKYEGWASASYLQKYAKGTDNAIGGLALTDEEGLGSEAIITKDGAIRQLNSGDAVFSKSMTKSLYDFALDPNKFLSGIDTNTITKTIQNTVLGTEIMVLIGVSNLCLGSLTLLVAITKKQERNFYVADILNIRQLANNIS